MAADVAIEVENLGKQYRIGASRQGYRTLRESLMDALAAPLRRGAAAWRGQGAGAGAETIWALKNVAFQVHRGEVVGILGRNGAGKSTLLKVLSRITPPTTGRITLDGRVGSLLEVGTGFHPELSGRENIFLNGAILGMRRAEIQRKFDDIVAFAEVERFIDTAVKHYSSGMYMRLAFAVAAHMEPEILVIDEVLAVGDIAFQRKCLGKMDEVARHGRTVLFVSHNMAAIRTLCQRCLMLQDGEVVMDDVAGAVVRRYQEQSRSAPLGATTAVSDPHFRRGDGRARFTHVALEDACGKPLAEACMGEAVRMRCRFEVFAPISCLHFSWIVDNAEGAVTSAMHPVVPAPLQPGTKGEFIMELPACPLRPNEYGLKVYLTDERSFLFDALYGLVGPLVVTTDKSQEELGFNPAAPNGAVSIPSKLWVAHSSVQ